MTRVTGMGCAATAIAAAFLAVNADPFEACVHAATVMGLAGEAAADRAEGPGAFKPAFMDALYRLSAREIADRLRLEVLP
jgi:hydroxyethylthiazole kinase